MATPFCENLRTSVTCENALPEIRNPKSEIRNVGDRDLRSIQAMPAIPTRRYWAWSAGLRFSVLPCSGADVPALRGAGVLRMLWQQRLEALSRHACRGAGADAGGAGGVG